MYLFDDVYYSNKHRGVNFYFNNRNISFYE